MAFNPFTYLPADVCEAVPLPDFPLIQDCVAYEQRFSEVAGIIVRPEGALAPVAWYDLDEWYDEGKIDNADPAVAHYIVGRGTFLPTERANVVLAGGRLEENRERTYRTTLTVSNMDAGHLSWARALMVNQKAFTFYVHTVKGRMIGGTAGLNPVYVDADIPFGQGQAREQITIIVDTEFLDFPSAIV